MSKVTFNQLKYNPETNVKSIMFRVFELKS